MANQDREKAFAAFRAAVDVKYQLGGITQRVLAAMAQQSVFVQQRTRRVN